MKQKIGNAVFATLAIGGFFALVLHAETAYKYHPAQTPTDSTQKTTVFNIKGVVTDVDPLRDQVRISSDKEPFVVNGTLQKVNRMPYKGDSLLLKTRGEKVDSVFVIPRS